MSIHDIEKFILESNRIEGIDRNPKQSEITEFKRFMALPVVTVAELEAFVKVYQSDARLRDKPGLNVRVGNHIPPFGGPKIRTELAFILAASVAISPFRTHIAYETLHPFTDGNGRSGRALWAWQTKDLTLGFLHRFYYQTLDAVGRT